MCKGVKRMNGDLLIIDKSKTKYNNLFNNSCLFHKPHTNLYYMSMVENMDLNSIIFVPQMTFRCHATDALEIMKEIIKNDIKYKKSPHYEDSIGILEHFEHVENTTNNILNSTKIDVSTITGKKIKCYLFLILFKLELFINNSFNFKEKQLYLKDFLYFNSRHYNIYFYERIKFLVKKEYDISQFKLLFHQSSLLKELYDFNLENTEFKKNAFEKILKKSDANFGNPLYSIDSYFKYLEINREDWLSNEKHDTFSTQFDLKSDIILIEDRGFSIELLMHMSHFVDKKIGDTYVKNYLYFREMKKIVSKLYDKSKFKKMNNFEFLKNRLTKKCKDGFHRKNTSIKCVKK